MNKDEALDSITHHEERAAKMRAAAEVEAKKITQAEEQRKAQQAERDRGIRHAQADELEARMGIIREDESREMLLERIRKMREDVPAEPVYEGYWSPDQKARLELEQQAGRAAVAEAEKREKENRERMELAQANEAVTTTVHHPNPGMDEQYPASKATLGKVKR